jgi:LysM repeat protein/surface antigen
MDKIDYTFKFSTELLVAGLTFVVMLVNVSGVNKLQAMGNSNLLAKLMISDPKNQALYAKSTTSIVSVIQDKDGAGSGIIARASADGVTSNLLADSQPTAIGDNATINNNTIDNPNPDTVKNLITDQVKVYVTQAGDTLSSISAKNNISPNTIRWANNLTSDTIKPGWDLVILPVDGVVHKVTANDTLPDIAKEFNADINTIISYNNLANDDDINPGDLLIIPGGSVTPPAKPKPAIANKVKTKQNGSITIYEPIPADITNYGGAEHSFPWGECTWYVAQRRNIPWGGNARDWYANAKAYGAKEGRVPVVGAIAVFGTGYSRYGHVAIVSAVKGDSFEVSEMNYEGRGKTDERWVSMADPGIKGFIY